MYNRPPLLELSATEMATLKILQYPDHRLRQVAQPVEVFDDALRKLIADMAETMYAAGGIGLAAVQVNRAKRVVVMDLSERRDSLMVFVNPELSDADGEIESEEGCLSIPDVLASVKRAATVTINAFDAHGKPFQLDADETLAICIQHEIDHLDGKVFIDYLSRLKRDRIRKRLLKEQHAQARAA